MHDLDAVVAAIDEGDRAATAAAAAAAHARAAALLGCEDRGLGSAAGLRARLEAWLDHPNRRLVAYGTLRPGQVNHHLVRDLEGIWRRGRIKGRVVPQPSGYTALRPDDPGETEVEVLESAGLAEAWPRLDAFEGAAYRRRLVAVTLSDGQRLAAYVYVEAGGPPPPRPPHP